MILDVKKIWEFLKEYWNLYSPIFISTITSWLVDWNANQMVSINQWLGITLSLMALLTMIKFIIFPKKEKNPLEKAISSQKVIKNTDLIIHQEANLENQKKICKILKKGTLKMIKWFKLNRGAIISVLVLILGLLEIIFSWLSNLIPMEFGFNLLGVLITLIGFTISIFTSGLGSIKFKEAIAQVKDQLNGDETELQNISSVKYLERQIMVYEKAELTIKKEIAYLDKKYSSVINDYKTCQQLGLSADEETINGYGEYANEYQKLQSKLNSKTSALQTYKNKLEQIQKQ